MAAIDSQAGALSWPEDLEAIPRTEGFFLTSSSSGSSRHQAVSAAFLPGLVSVNYVGAQPETRFGCVYSKGVNAYDSRVRGLVKGAESSPISKQACCWQQWEWTCVTHLRGGSKVRSLGQSPNPQHPFQVFCGLVTRSP